MLVAAAVAPASAHISVVSEHAVEAGETATIGFRVPHGCGEAATDSVSVQIPDGVVGVEVAWVPGWTVELENVATDQDPSDGAELRERVGVVRWSGGSLPPDLFYDFTIVATFPDEPSQLVFPLIQRCGDEELAWIQIAETGDPEALELPAPSLTLQAHGNGSEGAESDHETDGGQHHEDDHDHG